MTCEKCGQELHVGDFPFCKVGGHGKYAVNVIDDQIEGGPRFFETLGDQPVWIDSKSQLKREVDMRQLLPVGDRKPASYFAKHRRMQEECIADTGKTLDGHVVRER